MNETRLQSQQTNQRRSNTQIIQQAPDDFGMQCIGLAFQPNFHSMGKQGFNRNKSSMDKESSQANTFSFTCSGLEQEEK
ncbi:Dual-specificity RNA methyltransferase RlmN [Dissostichus eleginoides]|uniref:Dual-specificity RNA methyltransferase RlmN n=1 Tax=Dissostichus eleginoides TaxID=100907 RepID=A0AAD9F4Y0_DISEL|nr:Dual-specificity RNA methyltransferase RlmN [Dissostichus eleginoides]